MADQLVLVINSGSSSLKFQLVDPVSGVSRDGGERPADRRAVVAGRRPRGGPAPRLRADGGVRHRPASPAAWWRSAIGSSTGASTSTTRRCSTMTRSPSSTSCRELAPLHNPPAVQGIKVARKLLPDVPHIAVFDTAFFHDLPAAAATYAINRELAERWQIRRYGFHGTSHRYVSEQAAGFLGPAAGPAEPDRAAPG